jgi:tol-pal system-associated acyl-CoA thioesterase
MINEFIYPLRIHIEDTDFTGLVYHANYLNFMERARSEWLEKLGYGITWQREQELYFLVHSLQMTFLKPARLHELVEVVTRVKEARAASIIFDQYLRSAQSNDKILCKAEIKIACVDDSMRPRRLPKACLLETIWRTLT